MINIKEVLRKLESDDISVRKAYKAIYKKRKRRKARFLKLRIKVPGHRGLNLFLSIILLLPLPMFIARLIIKKSLKNDDEVEDLTLINEVLKYKPLKVNVKTKTGERVFVRAL